MVRVQGGAGDSGTHIENRLGEPAANPYLYMAANIAAGLDGISRGIEPPPAVTSDPYAEERRTAAHVAGGRHQPRWSRTGCSGASSARRSSTST